MHKLLLTLGIAAVLGGGVAIEVTKDATVSEIQKETLVEYQTLTDALPYAYTGKDSAALDFYILTTVLAGKNPVISAPSLQDISDAYVRILYNLGGKAQDGDVAAQAIRKAAKVQGLSVESLKKQ